MQCAARLFNRTERHLYIAKPPELLFVWAPNDAWRPSTSMSRRNSLAITHKLNQMWNVGPAMLMKRVGQNRQWMPQNYFWLIWQIIRDSEFYGVSSTRTVVWAPPNAWMWIPMRSTLQRIQSNRMESENRPLKMGKIVALAVRSGMLNGR